MRQQLPRALLSQGREDGDELRRTYILHARDGQEHVGAIGVCRNIRRGDANDQGGIRQCSHPLSG